LSWQLAQNQRCDSLFFTILLGMYCILLRVESRRGVNIAFTGPIFQATAL
jgi:hypothetical protein